MFTITFEDEIHFQWACEYYFEEFEDARSYLIEKGYRENNRLFYKDATNWGGKRKAYITRRKLYNKNFNFMKGLIK